MVERGKEEKEKLWKFLPVDGSRLLQLATNIRLKAAWQMDFCWREIEIEIEWWLVLLDIRFLSLLLSVRVCLMDGIQCRGACYASIKSCNHPRMGSDTRTAGKRYLRNSKECPSFFCVKRTRLTAAGHFCFVSPGRSINFHGAFAISKKKEKTAAAAVDLNTNAAVVWL